MVTAIGWDMYDPRLTVKGELAEALPIGGCGFIHTDGLIYASDDDESKCHGFALEAGAVGDIIVLVTYGRLRVSDTFDEGTNVFTQHAGSAIGSAPGTTNAGGHNPVGYTIDTHLMLVHTGGLNWLGGN